MKWGLCVKDNTKVDIALKDVENNHNNSLYDEIYKTSIKCPNKEAIFYRGKSIKYFELINIVKNYAKSLTAMGIKKDSEIPICMANCPEIIYLILAASFLGAKVNIFGSSFEKEYIISIIKECNSNSIFITDDQYENLKNIFENLNITNKVVFSLTDSLPNGTDYYDFFDSKYNRFNNKIKQICLENPEIINNQKFLEFGHCVKDIDLKHNLGNLDDEFSTTYSSGSTNSSHPKGIVHKNRSYITMGRFHDTDVSGAPSMHNLRILALLPTHSNTNIMSNYTDTLIQGSTICLEPIYEQDFFINSLLINKPNFCVSSRSYLVKFAKQILTEKDFNNVKLPYLFAVFSAGEPTSNGEEKYINRALRKCKAGTNKLPIPAVLSLAGGDCEHGGIFYKMFKAWQDKLPQNLLLGEKNNGMNFHKMVICKILDENDNELPNGKIGRLYAYSPCTMSQYRNNPEATKKFFKVIDGKQFGDCSVFASISNYKTITIKGRIDKNIPSTYSIISYKINDLIQSDTKNVLSSEVVPIVKDNIPYFVIHIEQMPSSKLDKKRLINSLYGLLKKEINVEILQNVLIRIHDNENSFALTECGKRNFNVLKDEEISKAEFIEEIVEEESNISSKYQKRSLIKK
jgi:acyl-coenzyme A synthetase/AMP-(fatty) acid ligase